MTAYSAALGLSPGLGDLGDQIVTVERHGVPYRMYAERPRRVEQLLAFADRWGSRPHVIQGGRKTQLRRSTAKPWQSKLAGSLTPGSPRSSTC